MVSTKRLDSDDQHRSWTFLSNHAHVLVCLARNPDARQRDVATQVGVTERAVHRIMTELGNAGVITRRRDGRRNHYELDFSVPLRHPLEVNRTVGSLLEMLLEPSEAGRLGLRRAREGSKASPR